MLIHDELPLTSYSFAVFRWYHEDGYLLSVGLVLVIFILINCQDGTFQKGVGEILKCDLLRGSPTCWYVDAHPQSSPGIFWPEEDETG